MAMPKGYRTNININPSKIGTDRRQEILDWIAAKNTSYQMVFEEDMDQTLLDFIKSDKTIGLTIDGEVVPVIF
jgi:hypothetical protein